MNKLFLLAFILGTSGIAQAADFGCKLVATPEKASVGEEVVVTLTSFGNVDTAFIADLAFPPSGGSKIFQATAPGIFTVNGKVIHQGRATEYCSVAYTVESTVERKRRFLILDLRTGWWSETLLYIKILTTLSEKFPKFQFDYAHVDNLCDEKPGTCFVASYGKGQDRGKTPFDPAHFPPSPWASYDSVWFLSGDQTSDSGDFEITAPLFQSFTKNIVNGKFSLFLSGNSYFRSHVQHVLDSLGAKVDFKKSRLDFTNLSKPGELEEHPLFSGITNLPNDVVGGENSANLLFNDTEFHSIAHNKAGYSQIATGSISGRKIVIDSGAQRFLEILVNNSTESANFRYLQNLVRWLK